MNYKLVYICSPLRPILTNEPERTEELNTNIKLGTGKAWINGHYFINDSRYTIDLSEYQDESLPRYVGIAIYLDI